MNVEEILDDLKSDDGIFPRAALMEAADHRDEIAPGLLEILKETTDNYESFRERYDYYGHICAMYLLAQFRDYRAYPIFAKFLKLPEDAIDDLTGDYVFEDLHRIMASVSCGDDRLIKELIEDESAGEFMRAAGISALVTLVACGEKSRKEVIDYFQTLFRGKLKREYSFVWNCLVYSCMDLYPEEVKSDIEQALTEELADVPYEDFENLEDVLKKGKSDVLLDLRNNPQYTLIVNPVEDLEPIENYSGLEEPTDELEFDVSEPEDESHEWEPHSHPHTQEEQPELKPVGRKQDKIGRNEPCPCGSGKKYKKCCGRPMD